MHDNSLLCPIAGDARHLARALNETERYAAEEKLSSKDALHLRLLAEELLGMAGSILDIKSGSYWIESKDGGYELHLSANAAVGENARALLVSVSSDQRNAAYAGIKGKIRHALDYLCGANNLAYAPICMGDCAGTVRHVYDAASIEWALQTYRAKQTADEKASDWDELEMSVLGRLADSIAVSVRPEKVEITVKVSR